MEWIENAYYLHGTINKLDTLPDPIRIASFDLDDTLINVPRSGTNKYANWKLVNSDIPKKIQNLVENNYLIIIFTNQGGMSVNKNFDKNGWKNLVADVAKLLFKGMNEYYFGVYVAKNYDLYRKPNIGLWQQMKTDLIDSYPDMPKLRISKKSFYVGDAAGRTQASELIKLFHPNAKADHSDTDRKFSLNLKINFYTPDEYYTKNAISIPYKLSGFNPEKFVQKIKSKSKYNFVPRSKELIIMVGFPGSGKTEFVNKYILPNDYTHINQDICKTKKRCLDMAETAFKTSKSVVVDNTNLDVGSRTEYINLAKSYKYKHIRCIVLNTDIELAKHLNNVRHVYSNGVTPKISGIVYAMCKKKYTEPSDADELFDAIEYVDFEFDIEKLKDPVWERIFMRWSES